MQRVRCADRPERVAEDAIAPDFSEIISKCYANPTREDVEWLADKIVKGGDYAKEAAALLRKWRRSRQAVPVLTDIGMLCPTAPARIWLRVDPDPEAVRS
ncbi:hypothetical protein WKW77_33700 [Variovorax ureilyticus]|uniref:Uncharacterized protein n=1 Tax=Variovorax ureilyticus TaxID=1836198 RepID=A0ABU8VQV2_9BURK